MQKKLVKIFLSTQRYFARQRRDTRYVFVMFFAVVVLLLSTLQAIDAGLFDSIERPIFDSVNSLPKVFDGVMYAVTQLGGAGSLLFWMAGAWFLINRRAAYIVGASGITGWYFAKIFKSIIGRGRPEALLDTLNLFADKQLGGFGFPSGHSTFVAACATVLYYQVERRYRKYLLFAVLAVGISRMYLGAHFPLDVIGGWALGAFIGSLICLIFGVSSKQLSAVQIKMGLKAKGYPMRHVNFADVDARGSRPVFMQGDNGKEYFGKIFGVQEHAADWLFKMYRFFRYKNLQAEEPYLSSRRNIELESFATLWASRAGVRVPKLVDLVKIRSSWLLILEKLDMKSLADHKKIKQTTLVDAWAQVSKLHQSNMAHRDLRAANLMVAKNGEIWIIDFGFAEIAPRKQRQYMDIAELLMSMSLVVGVNRTVDAVFEEIEPEKILRSIPYLQREVFSGATAKSLKSQKHLLDELKVDISSRLAIEEDIDDANIVRFNAKKLINIILIGVLFYVIVPQFNLFRGAFASLGELNILWLLPIMLFSFLSYVMSAAGLVILSNVPLKLARTTVTQLAASFMSKLMPGGIGHAGVNARYLYKAGNDRSDTAAILATHGAIGFMMFAVPLAIFLLFNGENLEDLITINIRPSHLIIGLATVLAGILFIVAIKKIRQRVVDSILAFIKSIREFTNSQYEVGLTSLSALGVSLSYIVCLYLCMKAFGIPLGFGEAVLVYASAVIAKSAVPTPGGLGPLEIAMVSTLVSIGVGSAEAASVVVLYRLATFWFPIPFSVWAYRHVTENKYI